MLAISIILQVVIDISTNGTVEKLYKVGLLFIGLVVIGILVYLLNNTVIPMFVAKAIKQYKQYAFSLIVRQSNTEFKEKGQEERKGISFDNSCHNRWKNTTYCRKDKW